MAEAAVVNASPLIFLSKAQRLPLLQLIAHEIQVPTPVAAEIQTRGAGDPTACALAETSWLKVVEPPPVPIKIQSWDLGPGESSVLACCAAMPGTEAILDDLAARQCAQTFGLPVRGTLGILLIAKQRGEIRQARPILEELRRAGMWLSDQVMNTALKRIGE